MTTETSRDTSWALVASTIRARRSNLNVDQDREVPREVVAELIDLAVTAPNHYRTNPWRFVVLTGSARTRLGEVVAAILASRPEAKESLIERQRVQFLRAPVVVAVASAGDLDAIKDLENKHAVAAGLENLLIGATAAGLASAWKSGPAMTDPEVASTVKETLGLTASDEIVGFVYLGYPKESPNPTSRPTPQISYLSE